MGSQATHHEVTTKDKNLTLKEAFNPAAILQVQLDYYDSEGQSLRPDVPLSWFSELQLNNTITVKPRTWANGSWTQIDIDGEVAHTMVYEYDSADDLA